MNEQKTATISEIRAKLEDMFVQGQLDTRWLESLSVDSRAGVRKLAETFRKRWDQAQRERERMQQMIQFDASYRHTYGSVVAGIDEAGRGCLAGPVVAAAVVLPAEYTNPALNDSKQMTPAVREQVYDHIRMHALAIGVGMVSAEDIDKWNILQATYEAMRRAIKDLGKRPDVLLNDAVTIPDISIPQVPVIHGDSLSFSIAAASVVAKVTRDRLMKEYAQTYPQYGFDRHVGYGTADHLEALRMYGPCPIHRLTFAKVQ
jgi:ribonuclease HII